MTYYIDIQNATGNELPLTEIDIYRLATLALRDNIEAAEVTIRIVNDDEMLHLNSTYRQQDKTTNVLAFPSNLPDEIELDCPFLGDVIISPAVVLAESKTLNKSLTEHWTLILIHGVLHLLGYDHIEDEDALIMQSIEIQLLAELGYANPYNSEDN